MFNKLIEKVTFTCSDCDTSIQFDVKTDDAQFSELGYALGKLHCPKCGADLSYASCEMIKAIKQYNDSVENLLDWKESSNATLN